MTTIDKIRAEIERLKKYAEESKKDWINEGYNQNAFAEDCRITSFNKLLAFLDTLQEPEAYDPYKTTIRGILKMFERYSEITDKEDFIANIRVKCKDAVEYEKVVQEPEVGLEKEIKDYCHKYYNYDYPKQYIETTGANMMPHIIESARHFYELGKNAK